MWVDDDAAVLGLLLAEKEERAARRGGKAIPAALASFRALMVAGSTPGAAGYQASSPHMSGSRFDAAAGGPSPSLMTVAQAARMGALSGRTLRAACASGRLTARKSPAGAWLISPQALDKWVRGRAA